ncbi:hypothetical protein Glove_349g135 [Diversispora epigaea]|uniref:TLDc domain-containing protein n=1 Tax=Diversispora epigaea TaxID=1348612 RepID=A0A397HGR9_9GLOM|nr:hypothetical protein Glove_349g135 [Diversispora epigaea]
MSLKFFDDKDDYNLQCNHRMGNFSESIQPKNIVEWNKENLLTLKTTLQQCLPYIKYFHISGNGIFDKIQSFKEILDEQLWKDLMQYLISPDRPVNSIILPARSVLIPELPVRKKEPFSTIITNEHVPKFPLGLIRDKCHGHSRTVAILKVKRTDEIFGGYNPLSWENSILSRVKKSKSSIVNMIKNYVVHPSSNFTLDLNCQYGNYGHYEKPFKKTLDPYLFSIVDYEIFKVIKKTT